MNKMLLLRCFLVLFVLVLTLSVFSACNEQTPPDETTEGTTEPIETQPPVFTVKPAEYALYVSSSDPASVQSAAGTLLSSVIKSFGVEFSAYGADTDAPVPGTDPNAKEILIGNTNRPESAEVLAELNGQVGYVIKKIGNKIIINANVPGLVDEAVQYFIRTYFPEAPTGDSFDIPETLAYVDTSMPNTVLVNPETKTFDYELVYSYLCDNTQGADQYDRVDYVVNFFTKLSTTFATKTGISDIFFKQDFSAAGEDDLEILLGDTNRPETRAFLDTLAPNEYGYGVVGNKLVITGWSDLTIGMAVDLFIENIDQYIITTEAGKTIVLLESDRTVKAHEKWDMTVPLYDDGKLMKVIELENSSYEAYYEETTLEAYKAYCAKLLENGYKEYQTNQIGDNYYGTYVSSKTMIHVYFVSYLNGVRFVTEPMSTVVLPQKEDKGWTKITDTKFTMMDLDNAAGNFGNSFIITLEDGSFILHDGGGDKGTFANADRDELWNLLNRLNVREDGKVVIAAWVISHQHWDHVKNSIDMINAYWRRGLKLEKIIYNVAVESVYYNSRNPNKYVEQGNLSTIKMNTGCQLIRMHTGQTIQVRNLKLEVLYTTEDLYPVHPYTFNNTCFVHRFDVGEGENRQRMTILGDIEDNASDIMSDMYGNELKTDIMQVAHHGGGGTIELYSYFKPTVVVWPNNQGSVDNYLKESNTGYYPTINKSLVNQKNVLLIVVADKGHKTITLPVLGLTSNRTTNQNKLVTVWPREDGI